MIIAGLAPLGEEYVTPRDAGITEQRWVDIYPTRARAAAPSARASTAPTPS